MTLEETEKLCRAIDDFDCEEAARLCDENNEPPTCVSCGGEYRIVEPGHEPTALDDACAHEAATNLARALLAVLPVVRAAEAWTEAKCARYPECDGDLHDTDCPLVDVDNGLLRSIATMHTALAKGDV